MGAKKHPARQFMSRLRNFVRGSTAYAPIRRARLSALTRQAGIYPDWRELLGGETMQWRRATSTNKGPRILIATHLGLHFFVNTVDSLLAVALTWRGARVDVAFCGGALPACQMIDHGLAPSVERFSKQGPQPDFCNICHTAGNRVYEPLGLKTHILSDLLTDLDRHTANQQASRRAQGDLEPAINNRIEEHAFAGALRFFGRTTLPSTDIARKVLARYLAAAELSSRAFKRLLARDRYDIVVAHHGIYVPQGPAADAVRDAGARLVTWHASYRRSRLIFEHDDTYHRSMIAEPTLRWASRPLTAEQDAELEAYLESRVDGSQDWITFQRAGPQPLDQLETTLGVNFKKPTALLIGSVAWDARLHYKSSAYGEMMNWAIDTAKWFATRPDQQLIIRCHPGEVLNSPRAQDRLDDIVRNAFHELPPNIIIVPPESDLNTYSLAKACGHALIYNTKMGVELAARGMPIIVAGDAWIRGKGFSRDASSPSEYFALLAQIFNMKNLDARQHRLARRYAYHFFFRRCIPVNCLDTKNGWPLCSLSDHAATRARPGFDAGLDVICNSVLEGTPFEYDDEPLDDVLNPIPAKVRNGHEAQFV